MDSPEKIKFKVNEEYENEKGVFTVISIKKNEMFIRWQDGEKIRTTVKLQQRIAERRRMEEYYRTTNTKPGGKSSRKSASKTNKTAFPGFAAPDFKNNATRTTWRSQGQLGAALTQRIVTTRFKFKSWAFGNKPEMHVQDITHRGQTAIVFQAKFFVRVDQKALYYGFKAVRPDSEPGASIDWDAFIEWLAQQKNEQVVLKMALKDNLGARNNHTSPLSGTSLLAADDGWRSGESGQQANKETLTVFINNTPETEPFDLELFATIEKNDAIACGPDIAAKIAQVFTRLLPLYQAALTR